MKTTLRTDITVKAICDGFVYNELEALIQEATGIEIDNDVNLEEED